VNNEREPFTRFARSPVDRRCNYSPPVRSARESLKQPVAPRDHPAEMKNRSWIGFIGSSGARHRFWM